MTGVYKKQMSMERTINGMLIEMAEFMLQDQITELERNALDETDLAYKMFQGRDKKFYELVLENALYDRLIRAKHACLVLMKDKDYFFGYDLKFDRFMDTRVEHKIVFCTLEQFTHEQMESRLHQKYGVRK